MYEIVRWSANKRIIANSRERSMVKGFSPITLNAEEGRAWKNFCRRISVTYLTVNSFLLNQAPHPLTQYNDTGGNQGWKNDSMTWPSNSDDGTALDSRTRRRSPSIKVTCKPEVDRISVVVAYEEDPSFCSG